MVSTTHCKCGVVPYKPKKKLKMRLAIRQTTLSNIRNGRFLLSSISRFSDKAPAKLINGEIKYPQLRVVFKNEAGENTHQVMKREDALKFARLHSLDLVLMNAAADPPVCKLEDYAKMVEDSRKKEREVKTALIQKHRALKEMVIGVGIDPHDLGHKIKKVINFLEMGHAVRVTVSAKRKQIEENTFAMDETVLKVLELVETKVSTVQQSPLYGNKKEFLLNPKPQN